MASRPGARVAEVDRLQEGRGDRSAARGARARTAAPARPASAAESSAGYPLDSATRVESGTSVPCAIDVEPEEHAPLDSLLQQRGRVLHRGDTGLMATGGWSAVLSVAAG